MASSRSSALPEGYELSEYRILKVLGHGGFGVTYLAEDTRLGAKVAVKEYFPAAFAFRDATQTISPKPGTSGSVENYRWGLDEFLKEARALAKFKHPHIVRVLRFLEANSTAYMVMEYEEGEPLSSMLKRMGGYLNEQTLLNVFLPILSGLQAVHDAGMLHLDIKPDNIYLRRDGQPMLIDFGSVRQTQSGKEQEKIALTPGYSAIEQYPNSQEIGPWSDVYSVGATLYRCVTGKQPVDSMERYTVRKKQQQDDPLAPATSFDRPLYAKHIREVIDLSMRLNAAKRPQTARELQSGLMGQALGQSKDIKKPSYNFRSGFVGVIKTGERKQERKRGFIEHLFMRLLATALIGGVTLFLLLHGGVITEMQISNAINIASGVIGYKYSETEEEVRRALRLRNSDQQTIAVAAEPSKPVVRKRFVDRYYKEKLKKFSLPSRESIPKTVSFFPNDKTLLSASADGVVRLWSLADGKLMQTFRNPDGGSAAAAVSADGRWLARADKGNTISLWNLMEQSHGHSLVAHIAPVTRLLFSPDASMLVSYDNSGQLLLWDMETFSIKQRYPIYEQEVTAIDFGTNSRWVATGDVSGEVIYWSVDGNKVANFKAYDDIISSVAFSPDGKWLATAGKGGFLKLWSTSAAAADMLIKGAPKGITSLYFTPDSNGLLISGVESELQLWDIDLAKRVHGYQGHQGKVLDSALSYDGKWLATIAADGQIRVWQ